jgi:predicted methyltransferase
MDAVRRPAEFLPFTQVMPGMQVLDVATGAGYTSQLLALAVGPGGTLWAQAQQPGAAINKRLSDHPQANFRLVTRSFEDPVPAEATSLDLVTIVLNYHDIAYLPVDRAKMNARLFAALRPGGHLVVVDHAARNGTGVGDAKTLHRIDETVVLDELQRAGFRLETRGDFLRNPADTREQSSTDSAIPTDKFALRFVKP